MGRLIYGSMSVEFEDRVLAHLQIVIVNKLRRQESFAVSWRDSTELGDGRSAIWIDPSIALYFKFDGSRVPEIDRHWISQLAASADSSTGLIVTDPEGEAIPAMPETGIALNRAKSGAGAGSRRRR
jgi:hypothetical protein